MQATERWWEDAVEPTQLPRLSHFFTRTRLPLGLGTLAFAGVGLSLSGGLFFPAPGNITLWNLMMMGVIFLGVLLVGTGIIELRRWAGILRSPVRVEALVTNVEWFEGGRRRNGTRFPPSYEVRYQYRDGSGAAHTCVSYRLKEDEGEQWQQFDLADVAYDRNHPQHSLLVSTAPLRHSTPAERIEAELLPEEPRLGRKMRTVSKEARIERSAES